MNILGDYISKPEHIQVGLNYKDIIFDIQNPERIIHQLRLKEHKIINMLKKYY